MSPPRLEKTPKELELFEKCCFWLRELKTRSLMEEEGSAYLSCYSDWQRESVAADRLYRDDPLEFDRRLQAK